MSQPYTQEDYQTQEERQYYDQQLESAEEKEEIQLEDFVLFPGLPELFQKLSVRPKIGL